MTDQRHLKEALLDQQEEVRLILEKALVNREALPWAKKNLDRPWIKVVMGIRRCGKSTFAHQLLKGRPYLYVNFDDERLMPLRSEDLNGLLRALLEINPDIRTLLLDEVQNVEGWELFVNRLQRQGYNLIVTGSNSKLLSKELATHLTGRYLPVTLHPFSFREFLQAKKADGRHFLSPSTRVRAEVLRHFEDYFSHGGFPDMAVSGYSGPYLRELYDKIITRDIAHRYNVKYVQTLKEIARFGFSNGGGKITYQKLRRVFDIKSVHTVKNYVTFLQDAFLVNIVPPFSQKVKEQLNQARKIYTVDNGMSRAIHSKKSTEDQGAHLENLVSQELLRRNCDYSYFAGNTFEVDFVVRKGRQVEQLIQVSLSTARADTREREMKGLTKGSVATRCKNLLLLTWDEEGEEKFGRLKVIIKPVWWWLLT